MGLYPWNCAYLWLHLLPMTRLLCNRRRPCCRPEKVPLLCSHLCLGCPPISLDFATKASSKLSDQGVIASAPSFAVAALLTCHCT